MNHAGLWQAAGSLIPLCQCMEKHWESQTRLMLCVTAVRLSKNALNLSSFLPRTCIYVSYVLYASIQGVKTNGVLPELPQAQRNNPISLLLVLPLPSAGLRQSRPSHDKAE